MQFLLWRYFRTSRRAADLERDVSWRQQDDDVEEGEDDDGDSSHCDALGIWTTAMGDLTSTEWRRFGDGEHILTTLRNEQRFDFKTGSLRNAFK